MEINQAEKNKIRTIVKGYKIRYPDEYKIVCTAVAGKKLITQSKYALLEGSKDSRALFEIPERLSAMLILSLDSGTLEWWKTIEGGRWFAKEFKEFSLPQYI